MREERRDGEKRQIEEGRRVGWEMKEWNQKGTVEKKTHRMRVRVG